MDILGDLLFEASKLGKRIVLAEGTDPRVMAAASTVKRRELARVSLLGRPAEVHDIATRLDIDIVGVEVVNWLEWPDFEEYVETYYELRKHRGITIEKAREAMRDPVFFAAMMVRKGRADGALAGAANPTPRVIRAALHAIRMREDAKTLSSFFIISNRGKPLGHHGVLFFADSGVVPDPTAEQLVDISAETARSFRTLIRAEPRVALLSYSTKGSAKGPMVLKVAEAAEKMAASHPEILCDGELQLDAALVPGVAEFKAPGSSIEGRANVLIFPDLNSGNIGYKVAERIGGAIAVGPVLQGLARPMNDLSRGCSVDDIVLAIAITALQAQASN